MSSKKTKLLKVKDKGSTMKPKFFHNSLHCHSLATGIAVTGEKLSQTKAHKASVVINCLPI
jgi:hypothetical protein